MPQLESFIQASHRPEINGGRLDKSHQPKFTLSHEHFMSSSVMDVNTIAFGPRQDKVLLNLEHAILDEDKILIFYYEDIHKKWTFIQTNDESYFVYRKNEKEQCRVCPKNLYIRGCQVDINDEYWLLLGEFYNFADTWNGRVICAPRRQTNNESKLYQLNTSLRAESNSYQDISIGHSYVMKARDGIDKLPKDKSFIVKSLSGVRSMVVDDAEFSSWNKKSIANLPVLFQEKVIGNDLRVHVVNGKLYGKLSQGKTDIDYRYDDNFFSLIDFNDFSDELRQFCILVTEHEENPLMGIDFIKTSSGYVVLEANPSPGWSAYHECNGIENSAFIEDLLEELKNVFKK